LAESTNNLTPDPEDNQPPYKRAKCISDINDDFIDSVVQWECPHCGFAKSLEVDAAGDITCDNCKKMFNVVGLF
jgi:hypothetical protein